MKHPHFVYGSLTRISNLPELDFEVRKISKERWRRGDYIALEVTSAGDGRLPVELRDGRMMKIMRGDRFVGALGSRHATLEATGSWRLGEPDNPMHVLTGGGLIGYMTSKSVYVPSFIEGNYAGHLLVDGHPVNMEDYRLETLNCAMEKPVILLAATSMSAGKTTAGSVIIRELKRAGRRVVAAKLTGAGRYKDILAFFDAGADAVFDFVDAGLPSTVCSPEAYEPALYSLLSHIGSSDADIAVIEIGASPLEPYNGEPAIRAIRDQIRFVILGASDPYAVVGLMASYRDIEPDIICGAAANTMAGRELVEKLSSVRALDLTAPEVLPELRRRLAQALELSFSEAGKD